MVIQALLKRNTYYDSITLMSVIQFVKDQTAVDDAGAVMATGANLALMEQADLLPVAFLAELEKSPGPEDLLISIRASDEAAAHAALIFAEQKLAAPAKRDVSGSVSTPTARSLEMALRQDASANLAVISVSGEHAWLEAEQALRNGLHVFLFSNNVSVEQERRLKVLAASKGLLLMGPDCGTAIINGVGLGFSNVVPRGNIGIVGASGTGIQQLTCLIAAAGLGIEPAICPGGRAVPSNRSCCGGPQRAIEGGCGGAAGRSCPDPETGGSRLSGYGTGGIRAGSRQYQACLVAYRSSSTVAINRLGR